jgi:hypothetical protein
LSQKKKIITSDTQNDSQTYKTSTQKEFEIFSQDVREDEDEFDLMVEEDLLEENHFNVPKSITETLHKNTRK